MFHATLLVGAGMLAVAQGDEDLRTVAEISGFKATARHADVVALGEKLARRFPTMIRAGEVGKSGEGRSLPLWVVAEPAVATPEEARASGKLVVLLMGNIHAGEVDGKEGLPMMVRDLCAAADRPRLRDLILLVVPIYNADGNERVSKDNRPGQVGPEEGMGRRENAAGLDLNRDFMKLDAPETRALVDALNRWDPHLVIDCHTTNGSYHRYALTYDGPKNPAGDPRVVAFARERMFPEAGALFEKATKRKAYFYGNFERNHSLWTSFPATPRFGTTYIGLRNRLSVLSEAYSYASYEQRVRDTRDYCLACLDVIIARKDEVRGLLDAARASAASARPGEPAAIRSEARAFPDKVVALGFVEKMEGGRNVATAEPKDYTVDLVQDFRATESVARPVEYLVPKKFGAALETLRRHGIEVGSTASAEDRDVEVYRVDAVRRSGRVQEGHRTATLDVTARRDRVRVEAGTAVVRTAQPLGALAVYLLEPRSDDGLAYWNAFDDGLAPGGDFPVLRVVSSQAPPIR